MHGRNWVKVSEFIGTKTNEQVLKRAHSFAKKLKKNPNEKGSHLRDIFENVQEQHYWTKKEEALFLFGLETFGRNWVEIAKLIQTKDNAQVSHYAYYLSNKIQKDPSIDGAQFADILQAPKVNFWNEEENSKFLEAVKVHGRDWMQVAQLVGSKNNQQCSQHGLYLLRKFKENPALDHDNLSKLLKQSKIKYWTEDEDERFCDALRIHGKDWGKIEELVATRTKN